MVCIVVYTGVYKKIKIVSTHKRAKRKVTRYARTVALGIARAQDGHNIGNLRAAREGYQGEHIARGFLESARGRDGFAKRRG